jgi:uncharacterized protein YcgI (DUF1989 family)
MKGFFYKREFRVPGGTARAFEVEKGGRITIIDVNGGLVAPFVAFNRDRLLEVLSPSHTRLALRSVRIRVKDRLWSNLLRPILEVIEDTSESHDLMLPACDFRGDREEYGASRQRSCAVNFEDALAPWEISRNLIPEPLNVFGKTTIETDGTIFVFPPASKPGDRLSLRALLPLVCAVCASPAEFACTQKTKATDLSVIVTQGEE